MYLSPKTVTLKDGTYLLHTPAGNDAARIICFEQQIARESPYLVRYEEEVITSLSRKRQQILSCIANPGNLLLLASRNRRITGMVNITPLSTYSKAKHRATVSLAVEKAYWGNGIGSILLESALHFAKQARLSQIELEVATTNTRAVHLYLKHGFTIYGKRDHAYHQRDDSFLDEYLMYKQL